MIDVETGSEMVSVMSFRRFKSSKMVYAAWRRAHRMQITERRNDEKKYFHCYLSTW